MWDAGVEHSKFECKYSDLDSEVVKVLPIQRAKVVAPGALSAILSGKQDSIVCTFTVLVSVKEDSFFERLGIQQRPTLFTTATRRGGKNVLKLLAEDGTPN